MGDAWLWWFFIQMLGLVCLPLTFSVFANLPDRGWALAKALGVLGFCFLVWFPLTLPSALPGALSSLALPYSQATILVFLLIFLALNGWLLRYRWREIARFARRQAGYIALCEALFAGAYAALIWLRAFTPEIYGTEKPMDEAFISAIMRSPHLPPNDPWLSGYSINYYYLGHFIVATLAKLLGTSPAVAFNTAVALVFALTAVGLFGVTSNVAALLQIRRLRRSGERVRLDLLASAPFGLAAVVFSLIFGNLAGASQWLAQLGAALSFDTGAANLLILALAALCLYGLVWSLAPLVPAWRRPGAEHLDQRRVVIAATLTLALVALLPAVIVNAQGMGGWLGVAWPKISSWLGNRPLWLNYNWWTPSRSLQSNSNPITPQNPTQYNNITEFPAFSFVLSDLHAHVLALPFTLLALGLALNVLLAHGQGLDVFGATNGWRVLTVLTGAIIIGGLYMLNGWDLPTYAGVVLLCLAVQQWRAHGRQWSKALALDFFTIAVGWLVLGVLLYLPFIHSFSSPSQGIGLIPPTVQDSSGQLALRPLIASDRSSLADFWSIFGVFLTVLGGFLLWQTVLAFLTRWRRAVAEQRADSSAPGPFDAILPLIVLAMLLVAVALLLLTFVPYSQVLVLCLLGVAACAALAYRRLNQPGLAFGLILAGTALALIGVSELVYLRDVFDHGELFRMNTVFKLYYQAWTLFSVACGALLYELVGSGWRVFRERSLPLERLKEEQVTRSLSGASVAAGGALSTTLPDTPAHLPVAQAVAAAGEEAAQLPLAAEQSGAESAAEVVLAAGEAEAEEQWLDGDHSYSHKASDEATTPAGGATDAAVPPDLATAGDGGAAALSDLAAAGDTNDKAPSDLAGGLARDAHGDARLAPSRRGRPESSDLLSPGLRVLGVSGKLVWLACFLPLVLGALVYPVFAPAARTGNYARQVGIDGSQYLAQRYPGDAEAIRWINATIQGDPVIVEATGGEYSDFGLVSTFTGLPTVLGWGGHEVQWRVNWLNDPTNAADFNRRAGDIDTIYTSPDAGQVKQLLQYYHARYLYVGALERQKYQSKADLDRFAQFLRVIYQKDGVTIYAIP